MQGCDEKRSLSYLKYSPGMARKGLRKLTEALNSCSLTLERNFNSASPDRDIRCGEM